MDKNTTMVLVAVAVVAVVVMSSRRADAAPQRPMGGRPPMGPRPDDSGGGIAGTGITGKDLRDLGKGAADLVKWFIGEDDPGKAPPYGSQEDCFATDADGSWSSFSDRCIAKREAKARADLGYEPNI